MSDLVKELREVAERPDANYPATMLDAAARIEALEAALRFYAEHPVTGNRARAALGEKA